MSPESPSLPPINGQQSFSAQPPPPPVSDNGFPMLAVAVLGITATAFLLVSYYIFVTKCCFRWHLIDPLRRRRVRLNDDPLTSTTYSPASWQSRGLNELLIREIPTFQYSRQGESSSLSKCVVCLNEFQENDMLRLLPKCSHAFHLDCIDVWLLSNSNCPLCRSTISGRNRYRLERIVAPSSSPQDPSPLVGSIFGGDEDFVDILIRGGDDGAALSEHERGDSSSRFLVQPIRRSFSMDSAADRCVYLSVQEILRQNRQLSEVPSNEEGGSRSRRSFFSFGHGRGSRNAVLPC